MNLRRRIASPQGFWLRQDGITAGIEAQRNGASGSVCRAPKLSHRMSALGQKRRFGRWPMSALPPKATAIATCQTVARGQSLRHG